MSNQKREVFVGIVEKTPCRERVGRFAYHIKPLPGEQQTDLDFSYSLQGKDMLLEKLKDIHTRYQGNDIILINNIPKDISGGWAPEYFFSGLNNLDLDEARSISGLEGRSDDEKAEIISA